MAVLIVAATVLFLGLVFIWFIDEIMPVEDSAWTYEVFPDKPHR